MKSYRYEIEPNLRSRRRLGGGCSRDWRSGLSWRDGWTRELPPRCCCRSIYRL